MRIVPGIALLSIVGGMVAAAQSRAADSSASQV